MHWLKDLVCSFKWKRVLKICYRQCVHNRKMCLRCLLLGQVVRTLLSRSKSKSQILILIPNVICIDKQTCRMVEKLCWNEMCSQSPDVFVYCSAKLCVHYSQDPGSWLKTDWWANVYINFLTKSYWPLKVSLRFYSCYQKYCKTKMCAAYQSSCLPLRCQFGHFWLSRRARLTSQQTDANLLARVLLIHLIKASIKASCLVFVFVFVLYLYFYFIHLIKGSIKASFPIFVFACHG